MNICGDTSVGKKRSNNQDCFGFANISPNTSLIVVCDGMGGANGGNVASNIAKNTLLEKVKSEYNEKMNDRAIKNMLISAINASNIAVFDKALSDESLAGMGTTVVAAVISNDIVYIAHVGDSRAYIIDSSSIDQITTDHSIVQMLVESGQITKDEAKNHPKRNIITRAVGVNEEVKPDFIMKRLNKGEKLLICTDGLSNYVSGDKIFEIVNENANSIELLINEANNNGGGDNITAVLVEN